MTFFWDHFSAEREMAEAALMANAAKQAGVQHVVWSTLEDTRKWVPLDDNRMPTLHGSYKVPHFDGKGASDAAFTNAGVPTTFLLTSFYWDNLVGFGMGPQPNATGDLTFAFPMDDKKLPGIAAEDIGKCAYGVFKHPELIGKTVGISGEHLSGAEMASVLTEKLGKPIHFYPIDADAYRALGFPGADDLGNMFQFKRDFNDDFRAARSVEFSRSINAELQSFGDWVEKHQSEFKL